ncbi:MAG TPA: helix-turn-helix domain-containing protein [Longimicrobiales bacterium]
MRPRQTQPDRANPADAGTRARILEAARDLAIEAGFRRFSIGKVAERAGVSRMTVYYQFGTRDELLEALFDHMAARGRLDRLPDVFVQPEPLDALAQFIDVFCDFWATDPAGMRRMRAWARVEGGGEAARERDRWRRQALDTIVKRIRERHGVPAEEEVDDVVALLYALTSFESYEYLAEGGRSAAEVAALMKRAAREIVGVRD